MEWRSEDSKGGYAVIRSQFELDMLLKALERKIAREQPHWKKTCGSDFEFTLAMLRESDISRHIVYADTMGHGVRVCGYRDGQEIKVEMKLLSVKPLDGLDKDELMRFLTSFREHSTLAYTDAVIADIACGASISDDAVRMVYTIAMIYQLIEEDIIEDLAKAFVQKFNSVVSDGLPEILEGIEKVRSMISAELDLSRNGELGTEDDRKIFEESVDILTDIQNKLCI